MARRTASPTTAAEGLGKPGWLVALVFAAVTTILVCYPAWPGFMSYDGLYAFQQAREGVETMTWPPLHSYMFRASDALGLGTGGVLAFQAFALFAAAAVILHLLVRSRLWAAILCVAFAALTVIYPTLLGSMLVHWRDVPTASFTLMGVAVWLLAARYRAPLLLAPAAAAFGCAVALRYNAVVLVAPMLALMVWRPLLASPGRFVRPFAVLCIVAALATAWASTQWRLPDLARVPAAGGLGAAQSFDLVGISACADRSYLPLAMTGGVTLSPYHIRRNYDPRHLNLTFQPKPGVPPIVDSGDPAALAAAWRSAVLAEPGCYLAHRLAVSVEQMGMARREVFYVTHGEIDPNAYGLKLAHPTAANLVVAYIQRAAEPVWRRPAWLYVLAATLVALAALRDRRRALLLAALLAGAFAYAGLLFLVSPAADARYIFPSNAICALLIAAALGILGQAGRSR